MSNKWTLDTNSMRDDFFADTALVGIASPLVHHKFCWTINNYFDIDLQREPDLDIYLKSSAGKESYFPIYQYHLAVNGLRYLIYKLKTGEETLLPELKQLDYLWLVQSNDAENDASQIIKQLRNISDVQLAQSIPVEKLKNSDYLLI